MHLIIIFIVFILEAPNSYSSVVYSSNHQQWPWKVRKFTTDLRKVNFSSKSTIVPNSVFR